MLIRLVLALVLAAGPAAAQRALYPDERLARAAEQMGPSIRLVVSEDIPAALPRERRAGMADVDVAFVARADQPLGFFSELGTRTVVVPVESLVFVDELSVLTAWFEARDCRGEYIQTYLWALLRDGAPLPGPMEAFGVDYDAALENPFVTDVSNQIFNSVVLFVLAHEVGHLMLGHEGGLTGAASQAQEIAADGFALDHFAAVGVPPLGMAVFFLAARWLDPAAAAAGSHPVSPARLRAIADRLAAEPETFASGFADPVAGVGLTVDAARNLLTIAEISGEEDMLAVGPAGLVREFPLSRLESACPA